MKIPPLNGFCNFGVFKNTKNCIDIPKDYRNNTLAKDCVSFSSKAQYIKKYNTLPDEIKEILSPKDAIDMFIQMDKIACGKEKEGKIGQGENSQVYENPWLDNYYVLILEEPSQKSTVIYSEKDLGDSIWRDGDNSRIQIIKGA